MKPDGRIPQLLGVFFPSLSRDILWEVGAVSRVRFAAQKPRALDTTPTSQPNLLRRKRREGVANRNHRRPQPAAQTQTRDPVGISLLRAKNGLDNGVHSTSSSCRSNFSNSSIFADNASARGCTPMNSPNSWRTRCISAAFPLVHEIHI